MRDDFVQSAAEAIVGAYRGRTRLKELDDGEAPESVAEAYAIQSRVAELMGERIGGYKVGMDAASGTAVRGLIFASRVLQSPAAFASTDAYYFVVEAEVAFRLAQPLGDAGRPVSREEALESIGSAHVAIELVESRFENWRAQPPFLQCADNQYNGALIVGRELQDWRERDLMRPAYTVDIGGFEAAGPHPNPGGDPVELLRALAEIAPLEAGMMITTGSCSGFAFARAEATVSVKLDGEEAVVLQFT